MGFWSRFSLDALSKLSSAVALAGFLASCGGGGGSNSTPAAAQPPVVTASTTTVVTVDSSVPPALKAKVSTVSSVSGTASVGQPLTFPALDASGDSLVAATDADNNILLAALVTQKTTTTALTADSTAVAFARLSNGAVPASVTNDQFNTAVRAAPSFAKLVAAISDAGTAGTPPMQTTAVVSLTIDVVKEANLALLSSGAIAKTATRAKAQINSTRAHDPFPQQIAGPTIAGVYIARGGVDVTNAMPITWTGYTSVTSGGKSIIPAASLASTLTIVGSGGNGATGFIGSIAGAPATRLQNNNGKAYDLTVTVDTAAQEENAKAAILDVFKALIAFQVGRASVSDQCAAQILQTVYKPGEFAKFYDPSTPNAMSNYLKAFISADTLKTLTSCFGLSLNARGLSDIAVGIVKHVSGAAEIKLLTDGIGLSAKLAAMALYSGKSVTMGVCENAQGALMNCAAKYTIDKPPTITPGTSYPLVIKAQDSSGKPTGVSLGAKISSLGEGQGISIDQIKQTITGVSEGSFGLKVTEDETGATSDGNDSINVYVPKLAPATQSIKVGDKATITYTGPGGEPILLPKSGVSIASSAPSVADLQNLENLAGSLVAYPTITATGKAVGTATVTATHPAWNRTPSANVVVTDVVAVVVSDLTISLSSELIDCQVSGTDHLVNKCTPVIHIKVKCGSTVCSYTDALLKLDYTYTNIPATDPIYAPACAPRVLSNTRPYITDLVFFQIGTSSPTPTTCGTETLSANVSVSLKDSGGIPVSSGGSFVFVAPSP